MVTRLFHCKNHGQKVLWRQDPRKESCNRFRPSSFVVHTVFRGVHSPIELCLSENSKFRRRKEWPPTTRGERERPALTSGERGRNFGSAEKNDRPLDGDVSRVWALRSICVSAVRRVTYSRAFVIMLHILD
jgi:hypothetical protein